MRIANVGGRLFLVGPEGDDGLIGVDVEEASRGRFDAAPQNVYERWAEFRAWADGVTVSASSPGARPVEESSLGVVAPRPPQVLAVGLNYRDHAAESNMDLPDEPLVFTKYVSAFTGPTGDITLSSGKVDWEVELVAVVGQGGHRIPESEGWNHIAGLTIGQDLSDRITQFISQPPQFGLGKSYPGYAPIGPVLVTPDEFDDPDDLEIGCAVNGEPMQKSRTSQMVFSIPALVAKLSAVVTLLPGDVIFTGTPAGIGTVRNPPRFLAPGDELTTWCTGIGQMRHRFAKSTV
ncbi:fumarylacetoacetate hydrolase family protein [Amycolatopsis sacchari]|uniref:fumarylacetoacetate hydrolase family protein n=1 Tax=Amycolatopsis sacchari TaxID=115433 RepID=UPI003EBC2493